MLKTPHFWAFWAKKADFGPFLAKKGPILEFSVKKRKLRFFTHFFFHFSENSNARLFGKMGTNGRTNGGECKGPSNPSRDQKYLTTFPKFWPVTPFWPKITQF